MERAQPSQRVVDGIRIAPHVHARRRRSRVEGGASARYLDCGECQAALGEAERREWNCGHLPRLPDHRGLYPLPEAAPRPHCDTCPGYLIALPAVNEALGAHLWWDKGQLERWIGGRTTSPHLNSYVEVAAGAIADVDLERMAEIERSRPRH